MQDSRVERREICSDMGIHAREPITNYLTEKGKMPFLPVILFYSDLHRAISKNNKTPHAEQNRSSSAGRTSNRK